MTAASVSAFLRRAGFNPLGSGSSRMREGIRVTRGILGAVNVLVDFDSERAAAERADQISDVLVAAGYSVERATSTRLVVR